MDATAAVAVRISTAPEERVNGSFILDFLV
jgi:hypothetical protein